MVSFDPKAIGSANSLAAASVAAGQNKIMDEARRVLDMEAQAISAMSQRLSANFEQAIDLLFNCEGKVVVTGMGKSGHIGCKMAATFASTGTPAFFVHPAELRHGDFGMLDQRDLVVALSGSGETREIKLILEPLKRLGAKIIALTGNTTSTLAKYSDCVVDVGVEREACPMNLAPTSSTTATLAMGDALAIVLMQKKGFRREDYAKAHPGGALGQQLTLVKDIMTSGVLVPTVSLETNYKDLLLEIDKKRLGLTTVVNSEKRLVGIITDGDIRRNQVKWQLTVFEKNAADIMGVNPKTISADALAAEALKMIEQLHVDNLVIVDEDHRPIGILDVQDLIRAGVI
jgi:arabinose-5-phosphate isomerase